MDTELNNQEEQYGQYAPENPTVDSPQESPAEPEDLAAAFAALRDNDNAAAQAPVASGQSNQTVQSGTEQAGVPESVPVPAEQSGTAGAAPIDLSGFDANAKAREVYNDIRNLVVATKRQEWQEKGYKKFSVRDLARRDEQTGRIFYINPNDTQQDWERPGYQGFTLEQAKTWVDVTNEDLNDQWKKECSELEQQYLQQSMPYFQLIAFANVYDQLSPLEQQIVGQLTDPYALRNQAGDVVGFSCDLKTVTQQAKALAAQFGNQVQTQPQNNVRTPATDAKSGAGGNRAPKEREPKDLNDAFEILWERDRQGGR